MRSQASWGLAGLALFLALPSQAVTFQLDRAAEAVAVLELRSPGADWSQPGREAAMADLVLDGRIQQQVLLFAGDVPHRYQVFLGTLTAGPHTLDIRRNALYSAAGAGLTVLRAEAHADSSPELLHAPILSARRNTIGKFSDVPLLVYCERLVQDGRPYLQYTVIFSNEDGGTSTRALMARWGRTTDIEYVYKAFLDPDGKLTRATIQARGHEEIEFRGERDGTHPLLIPVTDNNMVAPEPPSPIRYQLAPRLVSLTDHSREQTMDDAPWTYQVMTRELIRESKLRPFGQVDGQKISDPRNYVYVEMKVALQTAGVSVLVRRKGEAALRSSDLGRPDYAITRDGWVRTTVELPPGTTAEQVAELAIGYMAVPGSSSQPYPVSGRCRIEQISKVFLLDSSALPGPSFFRRGELIELATGELLTLPVTP